LKTIGAQADLMATKVVTAAVAGVVGVAGVAVAVAAVNAAIPVVAGNGSVIAHQVNLTALITAVNDNAAVTTFVAIKSACAPIVFNSVSN